MPIQKEKEFIYQIRTHDKLPIRRVYKVEQQEDGTKKPILVFSNYGLDYNYGEDAGSTLEGITYDNGTWGRGVVLPIVKYHDTFDDGFYPLDPEHVSEYDYWNVEISDGENYPGVDEGFAVANIVDEIDKDNYKEWTLYTDLQRGCFGDLINGEEVTGYLPESGAYLAEDAINASLNAAQAIVSDLDSKLVSDDLNWTKGGYIIFTSQPVRRG